MRIKTHWLLPLAALSLAACSTETAAPDPQVTDAWARETIAGQPMGAAYFTITNEGEEPIKLVGVSSEASNGASLHRSIIENGIATMRALEGGLVIDAGETATLEPGGDHVMFEGLIAPLEDGSTVPLTLLFGDGSELTVEVDVVGAGER